MKMVVSTLLLFLFLGGLFSATAVSASDSPQTNPDLELIHTMGCKGCHTINSAGGSLATNLNKIATRLTVTQIVHQLTATQTPEKGFMPNYSSVSPQILQRIGDYLYKTPQK